MADSVMSVLDDFSSSVWLADGLAETTLAALRHDLLKLGKFQVERTLLELSESDIVSYLADRVSRGLGRASHRRSITSIKRFFQWATSQGHITADPSLRIVAPRAPSPFPKALAPVMTVQLLDEGQKPADAREALRNRAILELAYGSGLRAGELTGLKVQWLNLNDGVVKVLGKGNKERIVPLSEASVTALTEWLKDGRPAYLAGRKPLDAVFLTRLGTPMTPNSLWRMVKKMALLAGMNPDIVSPHVLRHSFATDVFAGGADLRVLQLLLGHSSIVTTTVYLKTDTAHIKEVHKKHHPRG